MVHVDKGARGRTAAETNNLTVAIQQARSKLIKMVQKESKIANVGKQQPEFMHNLGFK